MSHQAGSCHCLFSGFVFGIKRNGTNGFPVACAATPALGVGGACLLIKASALRQDGLVIAIVALDWGDEANRAMAVLVVVPVDEFAHPLAGNRQVSEATDRKARHVLAGAKQRFGIGVVAGHPRPAVRRRHLQTLERLLERRRLEGAAVIGVQGSVAKIGGSQR